MVLYGNEREFRFYVTTPWLHPPGEREGCPKPFPGFVDGKSGRVCGDLEQNTPGLVEVDRPEVLPVGNGSDAESGFQEGLPHRGLALAVRGPEGKMVHRPPTHLPWSQLWSPDQIDPGCAIARVKPFSRPLLPPRAKPHDRNVPSISPRGTRTTTSAHTSSPLSRRTLTLYPSYSTVDDPPEPG